MFAVGQFGDRQRNSESPRYAFSRIVFIGISKPVPEMRLLIPSVHIELGRLGGSGHADVEE